MIYQTWLLRQVPDVARGEFRNVGVVAGADGGDWAAKILPGSSQRDGARVSDIGDALRDLERRVSDQQGWLASVDDAISERYMHLLAELGNNSFRVADPRPVLAESATAAAEMLFSHLVQREQQDRSQARTLLRKLIHEKLAQSLSSLSSVEFFEHVSASPSVENAFPLSFDFAVEQGSSLELAHAWSFDMMNLDNLMEKIQAWLLGVSIIREHGATVRLDSEQHELRDDTPITVVYDTVWRGPAEERNSLLRNTLSLFEHYEIDATPISSFEPEMLLR
ncbi:DUF3037 domain-containing protein [Gulosibacter macacae]|uniref:DUF3037 domain-containing protein n=1 Tax=Gulosibacter macacae TaxID=2488791 RepID=A0A3P3VWF2_9MICO|nr:DUF3037 domain-containing protein [Gulosibacter macacae]RRJ85946.1 DUF3037 domain-containing protein [Gulosibacter macacae]